MNVIDRTIFLFLMWKKVGYTKPKRNRDYYDLSDDKSNKYSCVLQGLY